MSWPDISSTVDFIHFMYIHVLTLLHSEQPKLHRVLAVLSAVGLKKGYCIVY